MRLFIIPLLAIATTGLATPVLAQSAATPPDAGSAAALAADFDPNADSITIGGGAVYLPDYEGSNDYRITPAPAAIGSYQGYSFTVAGNRASVDLIRNNASDKFDFQAGPIGVLNFNRKSTSGIDDPRVKALGGVGTAIELGGFVGIGKTGIVTSPYDRLSVSVSYRYDVNGTHKSGIWQPTINYFTPLSTKSLVGIFVSGEHVGDKYARTYYSVSPTQSVVSGLPTYNARGGWKNYTIGALGAYSLTGNLLKGFKVVAGGTYTRQFNSFAESPIVSIAGSRNQWLGSVGLAYTF